MNKEMSFLRFDLFIGWKKMEYIFFRYKFFVHLARVFLFLLPINLEKYLEVITNGILPISNSYSRGETIKATSF